MQKSHVAAVDVTYDITSAFTLGAKYAYRLGQISLDRVDPEFFDNNANLYVASSSVCAWRSACHTLFWWG